MLKHGRVISLVYRTLPEQETNEKETKNKNRLIQEVREKVARSVNAVCLIPKVHGERISGTSFKYGVKE